MSTISTISTTMNSTISTISTMGNTAPKGRTAYVVTMQYVSAYSYLYGKVEGNNEIVTETIWARNSQEAYKMACELDTRNGTAIGWEVMSCVAK